MKHFAIVALLSASVASVCLAQAQPAQPAKTVPAVPLVRTGGDEAKPAAKEAPKYTVDPKAKTVLDAALAAASKVSNIECVTQMKFEGQAPGSLPPGLTDPARLVVDLGPETTAPIDIKRLRMETSSGGKPLQTVAFDGTKTIGLNIPEKKFMEKGKDWFVVAGPAVNLLPQWVLQHHDTTLPEGITLEGATLEGEEKLDGVDCDKLNVVWAYEMPTDDDSAPGQTQKIRMAELVSLGRADHMPRRWAMRPLMPDVPMDEPVPSFLFTNVKVNATLDDATFKVAIPEGFTKTEMPSQDDEGTPELAVKVGDAAPAFALKDLAGKEVSLESLKGKVVLLDFWATWCGPCKQFMPSIQKLHDEFKDRGVMIYGVNTWERKAGAAEKYMKDKGYTYGCLLEGNDLAKAYNITGIPTLVVIGKDGKVCKAEVGASPDGEAQLRAAIEAALKGEAPSKDAKPATKG